MRYEDGWTYIDSELGVNLPIDPIVLLHNLGKHLVQKRIEDLIKLNTYGMCTITFVILR